MTILLTLLALTLTAAAADQPVLMESQLESTQHFWEPAYGLPQHGLNLTHTLTFALKQNNLDVLDTTFHAVSNPDSPFYGQYLTMAEVGKLTENAPATAAVQAWLADNGVTAVTTSPYGGSYIKATAPVSVWDRLLSTKFKRYMSVEEVPAASLRGGSTRPRRASILRAEMYHLPASIAQHVTHVFDATHLPAPRHPVPVPVPVDNATARQLLEGGASGQVTPGLLNKQYNIQTNTATHGSMSLYESLGQNYSPDDLTTFQKNNKLPVQAIKKDIGAHDDSSVCTSNPNDCGEANLDVQFIMAVAQGIDTWYWYEQEGSSFASWLQDVSSKGDSAPLVHSVSYGGYESMTAASTRSTFNTEAQKLGTTGRTIVVASGDDGVANFQARTDKSKCAYNPSWPAASPYVLAVGATMGPEAGSAEVVCSEPSGALITSGGGFSGAFDTPAWQATEVAAFLKQTSAEAGYNAKGRGYPDVAMLGHGYPVVIGGRTVSVDGTSASTPVFAAVLALVNDVRLAAGKSAVGFPNSALYKLKQTNADVFHDITSGANKCCGKNQAGAQVCCSQGFTAAAGWDPITGLGSVDVGKLIAAWKEL